MLKVKPFIFNWKNQYNKAKEKELILSSLGYSVCVINSDETVEENSWINLGEEAYFNKQFLSALDMFIESDEDILFHIQADASYNNWDKLIKDALTYYEKYFWGIYAPNIDYTWYTSDKTDINILSLPNEKFLKVVASPDCTCWFIHRDILTKFLELNINMSKYKFGWGWDIILPAVSYMMNKPVLRDYAHTIDHPQGTNYNKVSAELEMIHLFNHLPDNLRFLFYLIKQDREKLCQFYNTVRL